MSERTSVSASGRRGCDCGHYLLYQHLEPQRTDGGRSAGEKAVELGLKPQPWVKASLAPGSKVVSDYLAQAKLTPYLDELGFNLVGTAVPPVSVTPARCLNPLKRRSSRVI
jgi:hypothetical protein